MRALVTGGAGFIGSHVVKALIDSGAAVSVLDDLSTGKLENLAAVRDHVNLIQGSITDPHAVENAVRGCSAVFHLAAAASVQKSIDDPIGTGKTNVEGTALLGLAAAKADAKLIFSSSAAVYGNSNKLPLEEIDLPETLSPYAAQKLAGESYLRSLHETRGLRAVSLRYFNVYGPRQDPNAEYAAVVPKFVTSALNGDVLGIIGEGNQTRDFVFVEDAARANILAYESETEDGRPLNIGFGTRTSVLDLANEVIRISDSRSSIELRPPRTGEVIHSAGAVFRARRDIGFSASVGLEPGLEKTVEYWRGQFEA